MMHQPVRMYALTAHVLSRLYLTYSTHAFTYILAL